MPVTTARRSNRRNRGEAESAPVFSPIEPGMQGGNYRPLTQTEMGRIHALVLQLLEDLGLSQVTPSLEARAVEAGCWVGDDNRLRFPTQT